MTIYVNLHPTVPRVLVYHFHTPWTLHDLRDAFAREQYYSRLLASDQQTYHVVADMYRVRAVQPGIQLQHFRYLAEHTPANNAGIWVVRDPETYFNPLYDVALRRYSQLRQRTHYVNSIEAALDAIQQGRQNTFAVG